MKEAEERVTAAEIAYRNARDRLTDRMLAKANACG